MENKTIEPRSVPEMDVEEIKIGKTVYVVNSNASSVPKEFVKKTVQRLLFDALKQKSQKTYGQMAAIVL